MSDTRRRSSASSGVGLGACAVLVASALVSGSPAPAHAAVQQTFYVDGATGNDANPGTATQPFRTIDHARAAVRGVNSAMTGDIEVVIAPGDYHVTNTIRFGRLDSGTNGHDVVYRSSGPAGSAHLIGGSSVSGWVKAGQADVDNKLPAAVADKVYKVQLPAGSDVSTLYVNDERAVTARTKNFPGDPRFASADGTSFDHYLKATGGNAYAISYGADLPQSAVDGLVHAQSKGELDAQFVIWTGYATAGSDWYQETLPIGNVNAGSKTLTAVKDDTKPWVNRTHWTHGSSYRYFLQGNLSFLDVPGEYYYNEATRWLYYYPQAGEAANGQVTADVLVPAVQKVLDFKGDDKANLANAPVAANQVHNIVLRGLTVEKTAFTDAYVYAWNAYDGYGMGSQLVSMGYSAFPPEAAGSTNPSYAENTERLEYHVGAITISDANHITIDSTRVTNVGMNGIEVFRDADHITISNSSIDHIGMGGIDIDGGYPGVGKYNGNHTITNNLIHDFGQLVGHSAGITLMSSGSSTYSHLEIFNGQRRALFLNAGWKRSSADNGFAPLRDMYTVNNTFSYIYVHDCQQDSGEDSAIFGWILLNQDLVRAALGTSDPGPGKYNTFEQILIDNIGANPSMHDKNTVHGMDFAMKPTGINLKNVKSTNPQSYTMSARSWHTNDNINYNQLDEVPNTTGITTFDDSRMDYAQIGLTTAFPASFWRPTRKTTAPAPADVYFSENFEGGTINSTTKWIPEKGTPTQSTVYMSEGPFAGKKSLAVDTGEGASGTPSVLTRPFSTNLNKIVSMKFFDKRIDYAFSDMDKRHDPNSFGWVDNGITEHAIGADGAFSHDFYVVRNGDQESATTVPRSFGWHEFTWDYTSGTDVKMYIDGTLVSTQPATSFNRIRIGDPTGQGARTYFDEVYVYGGAPAPAPGDVVQPIMVPGPLDATNFAANSGMSQLDAPAPEGGKYMGGIDAGDYLEYSVNIDRDGTYQADVRASVPANVTGKLEVLLDGVSARTITLPSTGGTTTWATVTGSVPLKAGVHRIRLKAATSGWSFKSAQLSYGGQSLPGRIQAETYDAMSGVQVGASNDGGQQVGWIEEGDSMSYNVYVGAGGAYSVDYRVAVTAGYTGQVQLLVDGTAVKTTTLPSTGSWTSWATVRDTVTLPAGKHTITLKAIARGWNLNWFDFEFTGRAVPGKIQAEDYDTMSGVQVGATSDSGGGQQVGWIEEGDSMSYGVAVATAGAYTVDYRVAVHPSYTGQVQLLVDGVAAKTTSLPPTGGWDSWATVRDTVTLPAGNHTITLKAIARGWNLNWFDLQFAGRPVPSRIQAEDYDAMSGIKVDPTSDSGGGQQVGWIEEGDSMSFDANVPTSRTYAVDYRVAVNAGYTGQVQLLIDGSPVKTTSLPSTGGWGSWATVRDSVPLPAGRHTITLKAIARGWNLNWFELT